MILKLANGMGIQMTFPNGNTLSVMFSESHHCSNRGSSKGGSVVPSLQVPFGEGPESEDMDVCIWDKDKEVLTNQFLDCGEYSQSAGYVRASLLGQLMVDVETDNRRKIPLEVYHEAYQD